MLPLALLVASLVLTLHQEPVQPAPLVAHGAIELPNVEGRIDHLAIDLSGERVFVAARGNDTVEVLDLAARKHLRSLKVPGEPQGILYLADAQQLVVASGKQGTCEVYDGATLEHVKRVELGSDADNLRYDARTRRVFVAYGEGALGIVDAATWTVLGSVPLEGHPESFQLDASAERAFVNVPDAKQLVQLDLVKRATLATWTVDEAAANFPMVLVPPDERRVDARRADAWLVLGCRSPAKLVVRTTKGERVGTFELAGDVDDLFHDAKRARVLAVCGAGFVDVFALEAAGLRRVAQVATAAGARTGLYVPEREQLLVAVPHRDAQRAEVRVFDVRE
ncbi:MAG: hypothetical protein EXS08_16660 [Planctomycetes bacterium]|nr:hypothetical protein [Planctomycetota bacterium]